MPIVSHRIEIIIKFVMDKLPPSHQTLIVCANAAMTNLNLPPYERCTRNIHSLQSFYSASSLIMNNKCVDRQISSNHVTYYWTQEKHHRITVFMPLSVIDLSLHREPPQDQVKSSKQKKKTRFKRDAARDTPDFPLNHPLGSIVRTLISTQNTSPVTFTYKTPDQKVSREITVKIKHMITNIQNAGDFTAFFGSSSESGNGIFIPKHAKQRVNLSRAGIVPYYHRPRSKLSKKHYTLCNDPGSRRMPHILDADLDLTYTFSTDIIRQLVCRKACISHNIFKYPVHALIPFTVTDAHIGNLLMYSPNRNIHAKFQTCNSGIDFSIPTPLNLLTAYPDIRPIINVKIYKCYDATSFNPLIITLIPHEARAATVAYILDILQGCIVYEDGI